MRNQRSRIPIPEEGRTVAAPYEGGAATLTATFFRFWPLFLAEIAYFVVFGIFFGLPAFFEGRGF